MVGSWGLEPQTSTVSNQDATLNAMTLCETERHDWAVTMRVNANF